LGAIPRLRSAGEQECEAPRHLQIRQRDLDRSGVPAGNHGRQELAEQAQEGARVGLGLRGEIVAAAHIGERAQDHLAQIPGELVRRALPASARLVSLGHEDRLTDARSDALNMRAREQEAPRIPISRRASQHNECTVTVIVPLFRNWRIALIGSNPSMSATTKTQLCQGGVRLLILAAKASVAE
jgi:hypothetical protein